MGFEGFDRLVALIRDSIIEAGLEFFGLETIGAIDGALEGFVDDVFGFDCYAEEFAGDVGDGGFTIGAVALGRHGGTGADTE